MKLKQYPEYKESALPWMGNIPAHWGIRRLRTIAHVRSSGVDKNTNEGEVPVKLCNYVDVYKNERITELIDFMKATATPDEIAKFELKSGDVLITKDSEMWNDIAVPAFVPDDIPGVICAYHLAIVRPKSIEGEFLFRAFLAESIADQFRVSANGVTRYGLSQGAIKNAWFPIPPKVEQKTIATFIRAKEKKIAKFIRNKRRLVQLLKEQKQVIINQAVTCGIDEKGNLRQRPERLPAKGWKPSGVDWLGDIPEQWEVRRVKYLIKGMLQYGANEPSGLQIEGDPRYVRITDIDGDGLLKDETFCTIPLNLARPYILEEGDVLFARSGATVGKTFCYRNAWGVSAYAGYLIRAKIDSDKINHEYLYLFTKSNAYSNWISSSFIKATIQNISAEKYASLWITLPSRKEQDDILLHIKQLTKPVELAISKVMKEIELIREYRTRLISDVVTGKVDVRNIKVEDVAEEELPEDMPEEIPASDDITADREDLEDSLEDGKVV